MGQLVASQSTPAALEHTPADPNRNPGRRLSDAVIDSYKELMVMLGDGRLNPLVSNTFPLADTRKGIDLIVSRKATGKVVITIDHE